MGAAAHESGTFSGKLKESVSSVLPLMAIVLVLHLFLTPMPMGTLVTFLAGALLLMIGMALFTMGADMAMMPMGERVGAKLTAICEKHGITSAGKGICFSLPVETAAGLHVSAEPEKKQD